MGGFSFADLQKVAKDAGFGTVPDGKYDAVIGGEPKAVKTKNGKDMITVSWKISAGPVKGSVLQNFVISPESPVALSFFFGDMKKLGLDDDFFASLPAGDESVKRVAAALKGKAAKITVTTTQWNGSDRNEVKKIEKVGDATVPAVAPSAPATNGVPSVGAVPSVPSTPSVTPQVTPQVPATQETNGQAASQPATTPNPLEDDPF